jgi:hypothetical protein
MKKLNLPFVSLITVSWNKKEDTIELIRSLLKQKYGNKEIVVVDNASTDGTVEILREEFPLITIIPLDKNYGLHKGFNVGVKCAKGEIIIGVDQDCVLMDENVIKKVVKYFEGNRKLGIIAFNVKNYYSKEDSWDNPRFLKKNGLDEGYPCVAYNGCGFAVLKDVYERAGGLCEEFSIYHGEIDLTLRVIELGYQCRYFPNITVFHKSSQNRPNTSWYIKITARNWAWFIWKYFPFYEVVRQRFGLPLNLLFKKPSLFFHAFFEILGGLFKILRKRRQLSKSTISYYKSFW